MRPQCMNDRPILRTAAVALALAFAAACSTTRRLASDEVLYTGVGKIRIEPDSGVTVSPAAASAAREPLSVAPNNPLYSPYVRTPLPIGLWAYNYLYTPREKGFKYWFYKRLAKEPVLISKVQPSLRGSVTLDVGIDARFDYPLEAALETDVTSKSNSFLGPGIAFKVSNNNLFRGGEVLSVALNGSYEWQTGNKRSGGRSSQLNSYELGLNATLNVPRLLVPQSMLRRQRYPGSTSFQLGADLMNRPDFFRLVAFSGSMGYNFQTSPYSRHALTLFKLTYNKLLHTTEEFDRTMDENPAIAMSFRNQFVPSIGYTYTFDRTYGAAGNRRLVWQNSFTSAGNLLAGVLRAFGEKQPQELFGNRFSQFVKEVSELKFYHRIGRRNNWLAARLLIGVGYAYGNSEVMPYSEQFYIGGANSIRAFTIRSIGPGSYRPPAGDRNGYLDQTGDFKLEANVEYRFAILGKLGGAVFLDAGNVWLLKKDPKRPGAELKWKGLLDEIALGTGFGLRYDISYLVIRADLGIGLHTPCPDPDKRGYYNLSSFRDGLGFHLAIGYPF